MRLSFRETMSHYEFDVLGAYLEEVNRQRIFEVNTCGPCHTLADAEAKGKIDADLGKMLRTRREAFIRRSIVDPNAFIERTYPRNVMPRTFGRLSNGEIDAPLAYLDWATR
jgi:hypothetical protein